MNSWMAQVAAKHLGEMFSGAQAAHAAGDLTTAERRYREVLELDSRHADALHMLGVVKMQVGQFDAAADLISRAVAINGTVPSFHSNLAFALGEIGRPAEAIEHYQRAVQIAPDFNDARFNLGLELHKAGRFEDALPHLGWVTARSPGDAEAHRNLGHVLYNLRRLDEAEAAYRQVTRINAQDAHAHYSLGCVLHEMRRLDEARAALAEAIDLEPAMAVASYRLCLLELLAGNYDAGWKLHEWRWRAVPSLQRFGSDRPEWGGEPVAGKTVFLWPEQGFGDVIQFARFASEVAKLGARVMLGCPAPLERIMRTVPGVDRVVTSADDLPAFDLHLPLLSVPLLLGTTLETLPCIVPYLRADGGRWQKGIAGRTGLKVGIVWAGEARASHAAWAAVDQRRSTSLTDWLPVLSVSGCSFFSLQKGGASAIAVELPPDLRPVDLMGDVSDFADTAGIIANLDLVIAVDTAVAHLAGGMGKPVWILSRFDGCWRWLLDREDSPWYPTARIFRQTVPGDWAGVMQRVATALTEAAAASGI